jgi:hypothetical protein
MKTTHIGLVKIEDNKITRIKYMESKFERELGDTMRIEGVPMRVAVIGDSRNAVIDTLNGFIKKQNSIIRRQNKIANAQSNARVNAIFNKIVSDALSF